jgi:hypothetical protein
MDESGPTDVIPAREPKAQSGVRLRYANGTEVVHTSGNGVWFFGTTGKIFVNRGKFEFWAGEQRKAETPAEIGGVVAEYLKPDAVKLYISNDHRADWLSCIRSRKRPICDVEVGARTVTVCHLVNLAYYQGQPLKWDAKRERFVGGTGSKSWLDVSYRDPWKLA